MNSFRIDFDLYTNSFHSSYPIFLQEKNISNQEFDHILDHFSGRMKIFQSKRKKSQIILAVITVLTIILSVLLSTFSIVLTLQTKNNYLWILFGFSFLFLLVTSIIVPIYYGRKIRNETIESYQEISKEMDYESQKYINRGVQFMFKVQHEYRYGYKTNYIHDTPYIEIIVVQQQQGKQNQFTQYHFQYPINYEYDNNQYYQSLSYPQDGNVNKF